MKEISSKECKQVLDNQEQVFLVDVRSPAEFASGHIPEAVNRPLDSLDPAAIKEEVGAAKLVTVCGSGNRSERARQQLESTCPQTLSLAGGMREWQAAGYPVKNEGKNVMSLERQVRIAAGALVVFGVLVGAVITPLGYGVSAFVGAGLMFAGITDTCGMAMVLAKMPWNQCAPAKSCSI